MDLGLLFHRRRVVLGRPDSLLSTHISVGDLLSAISVVVHILYITPFDGGSIIELRSSNASS